MRGKMTEVCLAPISTRQDCLVMSSMRQLKNSLRKKVLRRFNVIRTLSDERVSLLNPYDSSDFQRYIVRKTKIYIDNIRQDSANFSDWKKLTALAFVTNNRTSHVIEIGGGAGIDFFTALSFFRINQSWTIIETEAMCGAVEQSEIKHPLLSFNVSSLVPNLSVKNQVYAVYMNASLQYLEDPELTLRRLLDDFKPEVIAAIRIPLCHGLEEISYVQKSDIKDNGPQVEGVNTDHFEVCSNVKIISEMKFRLLLQSANYEVILEDVSDSNFGSESKWKNVKIREFMFLARRSVR
jgi:putative methyltransferase (TIGR04325 family)